MAVPIYKAINFLLAN